MSTQVLVWRRLETQFLESWSCSWSRSWSCSLKSWWSQSWNLKSWSWTVESWLHHWVDSELRRCYLVAATMSVTVSVTVTVQFNSCHCASTIRLDEALKQCTAASCIASLTAYITVWCLISAFLHLCPSCVEKASYVSSVIWWPDCKALGWVRVARAEPIYCSPYTGPYRPLPPCLLFYVKGEQRTYICCVQSCVIRHC